MEGRVDELKEQLVLVETQMKTYHGEVMTEIKQVVKTFEPLGFLSEHAPDFQSMIVGYKKSRSTWGFVGKTALGALVVALVSGIIALLVAGLIQKLQPPGVQYFQPRYYPWLTPGMAETVAGLLGLGVMVVIHDITRSAVFARLRQYLHSLNLI